MKRECSLIRDLLPLYVEQMVSEESKKNHRGTSGAVSLL